MAVRTNEDTFFDLGLYSLPASIRQGSQVELKRLRFSILMVKFQGREVAAIAADLTFGALAPNQCFLSASTPSLLRNIGLIAIIRIGVLAASRAILPLFATKIYAANNANNHLAIMSNPAAAFIIKTSGIWALIAIAQVAIYLLECRSLCGPVAQLVRAGDSSKNGAFVSKDTK